MSNDPRITRDDIQIGTWYGLAGDRCDGYRAAYVGDSVLTGPEHAELPDDELIAEAVAEARRADILAEETAEPSDGTVLYVWVDNQPEGAGFDATGDYLEAARVRRPVTWEEFCDARVRVRASGHGAGCGDLDPPSLVASLDHADSAEAVAQRIESAELADAGLDAPVWWPAD